MLSAAFAYWIWPTKAYASVGLRIAGGIFAMLRASNVHFILLRHFRGILPVSSEPHEMEILFGPVGVLLGALGGTAMFGLFLCCDSLCSAY
jgi:hypothetical protein